MLRHIEKKTLPYSQKQMFDLVAGVDEYKEFTPWCVGSRIKRWEGKRMFYADLVIGYKFFKEKFSSKVILEPEERIFIEYQEGPLKYLTNQWLFTANKDGSCTIDFCVEFEFKNPLLQGLATRFFNEVIKRMVGSFEARAKELYDSK